MNVEEIKNWLLENFDLSVHRDKDWRYLFFVPKSEIGYMLHDEFRQYSSEEYMGVRDTKLVAGYTCYTIINFLSQYYNTNDRDVREAMITLTDE
jgi:hypothetical protein